MRVDFGRTAKDYATYRPGLFREDFERLRTLGIGRRGSRVLDVGTGTGDMARGLARGGARLVGLDPKAPLLVAGLALDQQAGVAVERVLGVAEHLPFREKSFDAATALQCWHWFDGPRAARELWRVLAPGGRAAIVHFDWLPLPGNVVAATEALILSYNPAWHLGGGDGRYPRHVADLERNGFAELAIFERDVEVPFAHAAWRGRIRASAGVAASLAPAEVERFDADLARLLAADFPGEPLAVPHRVFGAVGVRPWSSERSA